VARPRAGQALDVIVPAPPASAVAFVDARHGWVGGAHGLLGTRDGRTFRVQSGSPIIGISAFARTRAWALTGTGFVLRTSDGSHWSRLGAPHLFRVQFVDARVGYGTSRDGLLLRSGDAGKTWKQTRTPALVQSECFASRQVGWVAHGGTVWTTRDGGQSWARAKLRAGPQELPELGCSEGGAWVVFHEGAAAGTEGYHVFRSLPGGPWRGVYASPFQRKLPSISNYAGPFTVLRSGGAVLSGSCAPCGGAGTATLVTAFGRATWGGPAPNAIDFLDARHGWIVSGGRLRETTDAGRHLRALTRVR
jgi:photosystem II stability/assembly factor-like uncharacterized protein